MSFCEFLVVLTDHRTMAHPVTNATLRAQKPPTTPRDSGLVYAVTQPKRWSRTPLTAKQIDAIHTARKGGESVMSIARRFEVSRMTVWEKTRQARSE